MAQVTVTIAGKTFRMACDDGEEERLRGLAERLDGSIDEMRRSFGEIGDQRLTVMSAISTLDRLSEAERRVQRLESQVAGFQDEASARDERQARVISEAAQRLAGLAERLERKG